MCKSNQILKGIYENSNETNRNFDIKLEIENLYHGY